MENKIVSPLELFVLFLKNHKVWGYVICITLVIIGLLVAIFPFIAASIAIWLAVLVLLVTSIWAIIHFIISKYRNGAILAFGIIGLLCVIAFVLFAVFYAENFIPADSVNEGFTRWYDAFNTGLLFWAGYFLGFMGLINGVWVLCSLSNVRKTHQGIAIAIGIFSILYGVLACIFPLILDIVAVVITGIYLASIGAYGVYELIINK